MRTQPTGAVIGRTTRSVVLLGLLALLSSTCGTSRTAGDDTLAGTMWEMTSVWGGTELIAADPTTIATLVFVDGAAGGSTGCNLFQSTYLIDGDAIVFGALALTGSACDPDYVSQSEAMVQALHAATRFTLSDDRLELLDDEGAVHLRFRPAAQLPLVGIAWRLSWYGEGTAPLDGSEISLAFSPDGTLTGSAGCNNYSADYQIDRDRLTIGAIAHTEMACTKPEGVMGQEAEFFNAIRETSSFATTLTDLELLNTDGAPIAEYRFAGRVRDDDST